MTCISFRFIAGRYHATPWGRHVNEGAVEWPPSPWRILRALLATWKRTVPELTEDDVEPVLRALAKPPEFLLPPAATGHTRHFMPWFKHGPGDRTLVFDAFVALGRDVAVRVCWPDAELNRSQRDTLARILRNLGTLGRSESWCDAELAEPDGEALGCRPLRGDMPPDHEVVRLLCADASSAFSTSDVVTDATRITGRAKQTKNVQQRSSLYDPMWNLCVETLQLHRERWSDPPGSRWVTYARPRDCLGAGSRPHRQRVAERPVVRVVRYVLNSAVLPLVTETLPVAEAARRSLMGIHGQLTANDGILGRSDVFSGKDEQGQPRTDHRHAYFLPTDEDGDGRLDHLTVYAADGLPSDEQRAIDRLTTLRMGHQDEAGHPLRCLLLGMSGSDFRTGPVATSDVWESATPYIASRYAKTRGRDRVDLNSPEDRARFLEQDLRSRLASARPDLGDQIAEVLIEPLWGERGVFRIRGRWRPIEFKRFRRKAGDDGGRRLTGAFRLVFRHPVQGPVALGWSSHFGMGLFSPAKSREQP